MNKKLCTTEYDQINKYTQFDKFFAECPFRGSIYLPNHKPEEKVRLSLLYYLSTIDDGIFRVNVEVERYDISLLNNTIGGLIDFVAPALIIEVKREEVNLIDCKVQLIKYLSEKKASFGLLFNCKEAFFIERTESNKFIETYLSSMEDIRRKIGYSVNKQSEMLVDEKDDFEKAKMGVFESFKKLALMYRRGKKIKFIYSEGSSEIPVEGHLFEFDEYNDKFYFHYIGYDTKRDKRPFFTSNQFIRLERIYR